MAGENLKLVTEQGKGGEKIKHEKQRNSRLVAVTRRDVLVGVAATVAAMSTARAVRSGNLPQLNPVGWDADVRISAAEDVNPDPHIVEVNLAAAESEVMLTNGRMTRVWAFNSQVPGPRIEANIGDTLIVHLHNQLPVETSIHWHGV